MTNAKAGARPFEAAHQSTNGAAAVAEVVKMAAPSGRSSSSASSNGCKRIQKLNLVTDNA
jgi:hypothetical protein